MKTTGTWEITIVCCACLALASCQSSSQSSQSSSSMPSSPSQSSSNSQSMPSPASQNTSSTTSSASPPLSQQSSRSEQSTPNERFPGSPEQTPSQSADPRGTESRTAADGSPLVNANSGQSRQTAGYSVPVGSANSTSQARNSREGRPALEQIGSPDERDSSTGDINDRSGNNTSNLPRKSGQSGDYTLETLPNGVLSGNGKDQANGPMTAAERARVLDERLRKGYETFDGFILSEREKAQNESNAAGSVQPGADGGGGNSQYQPQTMREAVGDSTAVSGGPPSPTAGRQTSETFPVPDDIPSGRDDDVVARQLREAAMSEPDPALREALWEEYRNYTGIDGGTNQ